MDILFYFCPRKLYLKPIQYNSVISKRRTTHGTDGLMGVSGEIVHQNYFILYYYKLGLCFFSYEHIHMFSICYL